MSLSNDENSVMETMGHRVMPETLTL